MRYYDYLLIMFAQHNMKSNCFMYIRSRLRNRKFYIQELRSVFGPCTHCTRSTQVLYISSNHIHSLFRKFHKDYTLSKLIYLWKHSVKVNAYGYLNTEQWNYICILKSVYELISKSDMKRKKIIYNVLAQYSQQVDLRQNSDL